MTQLENLKMGDEERRCFNTNLEIVERTQAQEFMSGLRDQVRVIRQGLMKLKWNQDIKSETGVDILTDNGMLLFTHELQESNGQYQFRGVDVPVSGYHLVVALLGVQDNLNKISNIREETMRNATNHLVECLGNIKRLQETD